MSKQYIYTVSKSTNEAMAHYAPEPARGPENCTKLILGHMVIGTTANQMLAGDSDSEVLYTLLLSTTGNGCTTLTSPLEQGKADKMAKSQIWG